jgi:hypothetical protein
MLVVGWMGGQDSRASIQANPSCERRLGIEYESRDDPWPWMSREKIFSLVKEIDETGSQWSINLSFTDVS